jgi:hypothetical protein
MTTASTTDSSTDRYLMISADCHAAPRLDDVRGYVEPEWREAFDAWRARRAESSADRLGEPLFDEDAQQDFRAEADVEAGAMQGIWDSDRRLR